MVSSSDTIIQNIKDAVISKINRLISTHNSSSSAHSTEMAKKLNIAQTSFKGKNVVVDTTTGNIIFEDKPVLVYSNGSLDNLNMAGANTVDIIITYDNDTTETVTLLELTGS